MNNTNVSAGGVLPRYHETIWPISIIKWAKVICDEPGLYTGDYIRQVLATKVYWVTCPGLFYLHTQYDCPNTKFPISFSSPEKYKWKGNHISAFHYIIKNWKIDSLYLVSAQLFDEKWGVTRRIHTCAQAKPVVNIKVEAYGVGWALLTWNQPKENCLSHYHYDLIYWVQKYRGELFRIGEYENEDGWFTHHRVIACPQYPLKYCVMLNNNVNPFDPIKIKLRFGRFARDSADWEDHSRWTEVHVTTDDLGKMYTHCPPQNMFLQLWFGIVLGVLFLLLLGVAIYMGISYRNRKREMELGASYIQAKKQTPPSSALGRAMKRIKNFFNELCPRPQKPPPPPAPKRKSKPKKQNKKGTEKRKRRTPAKTQRREKIRAIAPPKPTTRTRSPKEVRDMKQKDIKGPERTGLLDTAKAQSNVGGASSSRRPRR